MGVRESLLNTITSVSNGDFIRVVTAAGASSKATLANVIKSFETGLGSKSSLTTSDYIRVVGSDNVSYKQLISALMEVMGTLTYKRTLTSSDDCNTLEQGVYIFTTSVPQNAPSSVSYGTLIVVNGTYGSSVYNFQLLLTSGRGLYYRRKQGNTSDSFSNWARVSRSDELDVLNNKRAFQGWGTSLTFTLTNGRQALVFVNNNEIYLVWNPTSSALNVAQVFSRSGQATATIARGDSNTEIVVTTTSSSSITALVVS